MKRRKQGSTRTQTGLSVTAHLDRRLHSTGQLAMKVAI
jgi:hypothetical protein